VLGSVRIIELRSSESSSRSRCNSRICPVGVRAGADPAKSSPMTFHNSVNWSAKSWCRHRLVMSLCVNYCWANWLFLPASSYSICPASPEAWWLKIDCARKSPSKQNQVKCTISDKKTVAHIQHYLTLIQPLCAEFLWTSFSVLLRFYLVTLNTRNARKYAFFNAEHNFRRLLYKKILRLQRTGQLLWNFTWAVHDETKTT